MGELEQWMTEEGVATGARFVHHMEYDSNFGRIAFSVTLREWKPDKRLVEYQGYGPGIIGGLTTAIEKALAVARVDGGLEVSRG